MLLSIRVRNASLVTLKTRQALGLASEFLKIFHEQSRSNVAAPLSADMVGRGGGGVALPMNYDPVFIDSFRGI